MPLRTSDVDDGRRSINPASWILTLALIPFWTLCTLSAEAMPARSCSLKEALSNPKAKAALDKE
eukprot:8043558-Prorocentrum_lima.AAC.1